MLRGGIKTDIQNSALHQACLSLSHSNRPNRLVIKDVRAKIFYSIDFLKLLLRTDNDLLVSEMKLKLGVTGFVPEKRCVENFSFR